MAADNSDIRVVDITTKNAYITPENVPLGSGQKIFGGGGGGGQMEPTVSMREYVDKADEAVESRIARDLDKLPTKGTVWGAVATGVGLILAILAFGSDRFNGGLSVSPVVASAQKAQAETDKKQDAQLSVMNDKLDILIKQTSK